MFDCITVLLVEDNPTNQMVAVQMLLALGAEVAVANDGAEALEILDTRSFDVLLVDIAMPRVSGIELMRRLRRSGCRHADTPMIALTAYVMREHRTAIEAAGADGIIAKPIMSVSDFGRDILRIMERRRPGRGRNFTNGTEVPPDRIDPETLQRLARTIDPAAFSEIIDRAIIDIEVTAERLRAGLAAGDARQIQAATHILIGVAGAVGACGLEALARRICGDAPAATLAGAAEELGRAVPAALAHLRTARLTHAA